MLELFGQATGFEQILMQLKSFSELGCTLPDRIIGQLMKFLLRTCYHWHRQFSCYFIPLLKQAIEPLLETKSHYFMEEKNVKPKAFFGMLSPQKDFLDILGRFYTSELHIVQVVKLTTIIMSSILDNETDQE